MAKHFDPGQGRLILVQNRCPEHVMLRLAASGLCPGMVGWILAGMRVSVPNDAHRSQQYLTLFAALRKNHPDGEASMPVPTP